MKTHKALNILLIVVLLLTGFSASPNSTSAQGPDEESLEQMNTFSVLAGLGAESHGVTQIEGSLGIAAEGAEAPGDWQVGGEIHVGPDSLAKAALEEARSLDAELAHKACDTTVVSDEKALTTVVLTPGVTCFEGETIILDELMLENKQEESEFIIRAAGDIIFSEDSSVSLTEPKLVASIYWQIAGSLVAGEHSHLQGTFLVKSGIETGLQTDVTGQLISLEGSVLAKESRVHFKADLPTPEPPIEPTEVPIPEPTSEPTEEHTPEPTEEPTPEPTEEPTPEPTEEPTPEPTEEPTPEPTEEPTPEPTEEPTQTQEPPEDDNEENLLVPFLNGHLDAVKDEYIVVYKSKFSVADEISNSSLHFESFGIVINSVYKIVLNGFSAKMSESALIELRKNPRIDYIVPNYYVTINQTGTVGEGYNDVQAVQLDPVWGLDRIDQRDLPLDEIFNYDSTASGVHVYVLDTGILATHQEFSGRIGTGFDAIGDGRGTSDCNGHGTHVAGTIGGSTYGVAKGAIIHPIRVMGCDGRGTIEDIHEGLDWVALHKQTPAVANMSIGSEISPDLDDATENLINAGVTTVIAAGNSNIDACNVSPGRVGRAITVGATNSIDWRWLFSNYGTCVDLFAPGVNILSAGILSNSDTEEKSGTSMAAPHVTGVVALFLEKYPTATPDQVSDYISFYATKNKVSFRGAGSPDRLLYSRFFKPTPLSPYGYIYQQNPTFKWTKVLNASSYNIQIYVPGSLLITKVVTSSVCGATICSEEIGPLPYVSQYYWRVRAYDGTWEPWSGYQYFTRLDPVPTLLAPSGFVTVSDPMFKWSRIPGASFYNIEIYSSNSLYTHRTLTALSCGSTTCGVRIYGVPYGSYYWRVKAYFDGQWQSFSPFAYFSRVQPPPTLKQPVGTIYLKYPTFQWTKVPGAYKYNIQIYVPDGLVIDRLIEPSACGITNCSAAIGPLPYISQYFWRVRAYNFGIWGPWSSYGYFTRLAPVPLLYSPSGIITIPNPQFLWKPINGATNYNIELYRNNSLYAYMTLTSNACSSTICQVRISNNLPYGNYFWRVKAYTEGNWGPFSQNMYFSRSTSFSNVTGSVVSAVNGLPLSGASVCSMKSGQCTTTNYEGSYYLANVSAGYHSFRVSIAGYLTATETLLVLGPQTITKNFALSPTLSPGEMRIVLTWGENPRDLDSHLWLPDATPYHIYYANKGRSTSFPYALLDYDDVTSYGPETTTIFQRYPGTYTYAVYLYSGTGTLPTSGARVQVYGTSGLITQFYVPATGSGRWWYVFDFDGSTGVITPTNYITETSPAPFSILGESSVDSPK